MDYIDDFDEERILDEIRRVSRDLRLLETKKNPYLHISSNLEALYGMDLGCGSPTRARTKLKESTAAHLNGKHDIRPYKKKSSSLPYLTLDSIYEEDIDEREARSYADDEGDDEEEEFQDCAQQTPNLDYVFQKAPTALESQLWHLLNPQDTDVNSISDARSAIMYQRIAGDTDSEDMDTQHDIDSTDACDSPDATGTTPEISTPSQEDSIESDNSNEVTATITDNSKAVEISPSKDFYIPFHLKIGSADTTRDSTTSQVSIVPLESHSTVPKLKSLPPIIQTEPVSPPPTPKTLKLHHSPTRLPQDLDELQNSYKTTTLIPFPLRSISNSSHPPTENSSVASLPPPLPPKDANQDFKYLRKAKRRSMKLVEDAETNPFTKVFTDIKTESKVAPIDFDKNGDDIDDANLGAKDDASNSKEDETKYLSFTSKDDMKELEQLDNYDVQSLSEEEFARSPSANSSNIWDENKENVPEIEVPDLAVETSSNVYHTVDGQDPETTANTTCDTTNESAEQSKLDLLLLDIAQYSKQDNCENLTHSRTPLLDSNNGTITTPINSRIQTLMESLANYVEENENSVNLKKFVNDVLTRPPNASKDAINESPIMANCDDSQLIEKLESLARVEPRRVSSAVTPPFPATSTLSARNSISSESHVDVDMRHYSYYFDSNGLIPIDLEDYFEFFEPPILTEWDVDILDGSETPLMTNPEKLMNKESASTFLTANEMPLDIEKDEEYDLFDMKSELKRHSDMNFSMGGKSNHGSESSYEFHINPRASMSNKSYTTRGSGSRRSSKSLSVYYYDKPLPQTPFADGRLPFANELSNGKSDFDSGDDVITLAKLLSVDPPSPYINLANESIMEGVTPSYYEKEEANFFTEYDSKTELLYLSNNEDRNREPDIQPRTISDRNISIQLDYCLVNLESVNQFFSLMNRIISCKRIELKLMVSNEQVVKYILNRLSRLEVYDTITLMGLFPALMMSNDIMNSPEFKNMLQTGISITKLPAQLLKLVIANRITMDAAIVFPPTLSVFGLHNSKGFNLTKFNNVKHLKKVTITNDPEEQSLYPSEVTDGAAELAVKQKQRAAYPAKLVNSVTDLALSKDFVVSNDFEKFTYLKSLTLAGLEADVFKTIVFPKSVKSLTLKNCTLSPNLLARLPPSVKRLKLLYCKLWRQSDPQIGMGLQLRGIEMEKCVFTNLDFLQKISSLNTLAIKSCGITEVDQESNIKFPSNLRHLDFSHNRIYELDASALPSSLVKLNLQGNLLTHIKHISRISNIQYLSLTDNKLKHELDLTSLKCLRILYLDGNRFLENVFFPKSVEKVNLSRTELVNFPFNSSEFTKIHTVVMNSCQIVRPFLFVPQSLVKLHLKNCNILKLSFVADDFDKCELAYVDLSSNNLSSIDLGKFPRLNSLNIRDNAFVTHLAIETPKRVSVQF